MSCSQDIYGFAVGALDDHFKIEPIPVCTAFQFHMFLRYGFPYVDNIIRRRFGRLAIDWKTGKMTWFPCRAKNDSNCGCVNA